MTSEIQEVKLKLCSYCSYQERSTLEVETKMRDFDLNEKDKEDLLDYLVDEGFLDDHRFAMTYAGSKFRLKKWGKFKIRISLQQKGIPDYLCDEALSEISDEDCYEAMLNLFRLKLYNFVKSKGYDNEMIWKGIGEVV